MFLLLVWHGVLKSVRYVSISGVRAAQFDFAAGRNVSMRTGAAGAIQTADGEGVHPAPGEVRTGSRVFTLAIRDAFPELLLDGRRFRRDSGLPRCAAAAGLGGAR